MEACISGYARELMTFQVKKREAIQRREGSLAVVWSEKVAEMLS